MPSANMQEILQLIETEAHALPAPIEFEMAYQARVALDRIRFAIKQTEQFAPHTDPMREVGLQLRDALERLESVERRFQQRSRSGRSLSSLAGNGVSARVNGKGASCGSTNGA